MTLTMNVELPDTFSPELKNLLESLLQVIILLLLLLLFLILSLLTYQSQCQLKLSWAEIALLSVKILLRFQVYHIRSRPYILNIQQDILRFTKYVTVLEDP